jgi:phosphoribosylglycinamide formyltransferase-1
MYGHRVHESVIASSDRESGITIHYVNERYDEGNIIFQAKCNIEKGDTPETLAAKIHELEYTHFPVIIEKVIHSLM